MDQTKTNAIIYKGPKCQRCELHLNGSDYAVFKFHHTDQNPKEGDWSKLRLKS